LRAVQVCDGIDQLEYHKHHCAHEGVKMISNTRVFQGSPECVSEGQSWFHPDIIIGACIEGIGSVRQCTPGARCARVVSARQGLWKRMADWGERR
jgi:hypothetical protein